MALRGPLLIAKCIFIVYAKGLLGTSPFIGLCFYLLKLEVKQTKWKESKVLLVFICSYPPTCIGNLIVESNGKVMEACISYCPAASMWRGTGKHSLLLSQCRLGIKQHWRVVKGFTWCMMAPKLAGWHVIVTKINWPHNAGRDITMWCMICYCFYKNMTCDLPIRFLWWVDVLWSRRISFIRSNYM